MSKSTPPAEKLSSNRVGPRGLALIIATALFMEQLDTTILTTALPRMASSFGVSPISLSIAITSYLLSLAIFIPASGQVADRFGSRLVFRAAIVIFTISSACCGFATSLPMLAAFRFLQGLGGAMMVPVGRLLLFRSISKSELIGANSWLLVPGLMGPVVGPPVGGILVTYANWHWIFWVNIPIGIVGFLLVTFLIGDVREFDPEPFDFGGLTLSGLALSLILSGLEIASQGIWPKEIAAAIGVTGLAVGVAYVRHALSCQHPVLDLRLLRKVTFRTAIVGGMLIRFGFGSLPFLLPLLFQLGFGLSAAKSGAITFASAAGSMAMKSMTVRILRRWGYRRVMIWNAFVCAGFLVLCAFFRPSWPIEAIYLVLFVGGLFRSLQYNAFGSIAYAEISHKEMSAATSFNMTIQQMSVTVGIAVSALILHSAMLVTGDVQPNLPDFSVAFFAAAILSLFPLSMSIALPENVGSELTGRRSASAKAPQS